MEIAPMPSTAAARLTVAEHLQGREPIVAKIYARLLSQAESFGPVTEDPKKTSIHLVRSTAFAGIAVQQRAIVLTLRLTHDVRSARVRRHEQASRNRWHLELKLESPADVDRDVMNWLREAYDLAE
jgi:hypothetical protein